MEKQYTTNNKFYIILTIAILALVIGAIGLIISLQRPAAQTTLPTGGTNSAVQPPGGGDVQTMEIDPSTGRGVAESPKKN